MKNSFLIFITFALFFLNGKSQNGTINDDFLILDVVNFQNPVYVQIVSKNQYAIMEYDNLSKIKIEQLDSNKLVFEKFAYDYCLFSPKIIKEIILPNCNGSLYLIIENIYNNYYKYRNELNNFENKYELYKEDFQYKRLKNKKYLCLLVRLKTYSKIIYIDPNPYIPYYNKPNFDGLYVKILFPIVENFQ